MWILYAVLGLVTLVGGGAYATLKVHDLRIGDVVTCQLSDIALGGNAQLEQASRALNGALQVVVNGLNSAGAQFTGTIDLSRVLPVVGATQMPVTINWRANMPATRNGKPFIANGPSGFFSAKTAVAPPVAFPQIPGALPNLGPSAPGIQLPSMGIAQLVTMTNPDLAPAAIPAQAATLQQQLIDALNTPQGDRTPEQLALLLGLAQLPPAPQLDALKTIAMGSPDGAKVLSDISSLNAPEQLAMLRMLGGLAPA